MNPSDKTKDRLIASIRKTKAAAPEGETGPGEAAASSAATPQPRSTKSSQARAKPAVQAGTGAKREPAEADKTAGAYSLGGLRWPD